MGGKVKDLTGKSFGRWKVEKRDISYFGKGVGAHWICECKCGMIKSVNGARLRCGRSKSCGCLAFELSAERNYKHGFSRSATYRTWIRMRSRCNDENNPSYKNYGGRGIKVCARWENSFKAFFEDMRERPGNIFSIDRINNEGDYEPGNCRWSTAREQRNNSRQNRFICIDGTKKTIAQWSRYYGVSPSTAWMRLRRGLSPEEAFAK